MGVFTTSKQFALEIDMPGWWLAGSSVDLDFVHGRYFDSSLPAPAAVSNLLSISRASVGYAKTSGGTLTQFASGQLRITDLGLLIEDARTNLARQSQDFTTTWGKSGFTINTGIIAPDGTSTADQFVETSVTVQFEVFQTIAALVTATTYAFSVWLKQESRPYAFLNIQDAAANNWITAVFDLSLMVVGETAHGSSSGTIVSSSIEVFANGWYRCTIVGSLTITSNPNIVIGRANVASGNSFNNVGEILTTGTVGTLAFDAWGAQIEQASFASSYIPTTTTSATRAADAVTTSGTLQTVVAAATGTLLALTNNGEGAGFAANIVDSNGTNLLGFDSSNHALASMTATLATGNSASRTARDEYGLAWNPSGRSLALNGGTVATDASAQTPSSTQHVGSSGSANFAYAYIQRLTAWNSKLADATLQALTAP